MLFSDPMVLALMREIQQPGTGKTQTRRVINELRGFGRITEFQRSDTPGYDWTFRDNRMCWNDITHQRLMECCPYGAPGDLLWVRESTAEDPAGSTSFARYTADDSMIRENGNCLAPWWYSKRSCPSIHMPRRFSRMTLAITDIGVERLQDISEADAIAEGLVQVESGAWLPGPCDHPGWAFHQLWAQINGESSWDANPYVWPITFTPVLENVDRYIERRRQERVAKYVDF